MDRCFKLRESKKVWVIGANSFTGRYLVPALKKADYSVTETIVDITNAQQVEQLMHLL